MQGMYYIGLDAHKRTISYYVKDVSGRIHQEGSIPATRIDLDRWMNTNSSAAVDGRDGGDGLHRLDLRSPCSPCVATTH